jgi:hypothetical protein
MRLQNIVSLNTWNLGTLNLEGHGTSKLRTSKGMECRNPELLWTYNLQTPNLERYGLL